MNIFDYLIKSFANNSKYQKILSDIKKHKNNFFDINIQNLYGSSKSFFINQLFSDLNKNLLIITSTSKEAEYLYQDIKSFSKNENIFYFPSWEILPYESISPFYDIVHHRIEVLHHISEKKKVLIFTPIVNLIKNIIPKKNFREEYLSFKVEKKINYEKIIIKLIHLGYNRESKVNTPGTFCLKGGIIDIFPSSYKDPIRIEFFDDKIESIRVFDSITQLSKNKLDYVQVLPQRELIFTEKSSNKAISIIKERFSHLENSKEIINKIKKNIYFQGIEHLIPFFYEKETLLDYFNSIPILILDEKEKINEKNDLLLKELDKLYEQSHKKKIIKAKPKEILKNYKEIKSKIIQYINLNQLPKFIENNTTYNLSIRSSESISGNFSFFKKEAKKKMEKGYKIVIFTTYKARFKHLQFLLKDVKNELNLSSSNNNLLELDNTNSEIKIIVGELSSGFEFLDEKIFVLLDREIFGRHRKLYKKLRKVHAVPIEGFYDLLKDDLVVHINHGIGSYKGIEQIKASGKFKDFILLLYADNEKLYVPVEQLNLIQKYIGSSEKKIQLDKLGSKNWEKNKTKVKKSLEEVAKELVKIYSARKNLKGFSFPKDNPWQHEFESSFQYEETEDQLKALEEIKKDMESFYPMDRLICGDVGYGKTEVAIRAIFKAVMAGKQVAVLSPTTILCEQHFRTFTDRFISYPIKIEMLSRVKSSSEQKKIIKELINGKIDVIIGTHRLISKDVSFKNLGLVVIDEEQRFGVRHKESLKSFKKLVDVISMSATPIPRTLHMSLVKIREMSSIETPPENRLPIETYLMEFNKEVIQDAIYREFNREGQVYFMFNRIKNIKSFARSLKELVPKAKICVAHGQMEEEDLEQIIVDFINHKYNIMVCTTIIESGIDIPNANTILIDRADTFGLSQLYQLRGRVGRGNKKAYCYLFYPENKVLSEIAQKRLTIINEYTNLGSGFKIAMKDMEFRGTGNVLGLEQSGNILSVGFGLYCKLLDQAVNELEKNDNESFEDIYIDLKDDGYIPDEYISDQKQKIEIYKKISAASSEEEINNLNKELKDRFGLFPKSIDNLLKIAEIRFLGNKFKITSIIEKENIKKNTTNNFKELMFDFGKKSLIKAEKILFLNNNYKKILRINPKESNKLYLRISNKNLSEKVKLIKDFLYKIS